MPQIKFKKILYKSFGLLTNILSPKQSTYWKESYVNTKVRSYNTEKRNYKICDNIFKDQQKSLMYKLFEIVNTFNFIM